MKEDFETPLSCKQSFKFSLFSVFTCVPFKWNGLFCFRNMESMCIAESFSSKANSILFIYFNLLNRSQVAEETILLGVTTSYYFECIISRLPGVRLSFRGIQRRNEVRSVEASTQSSIFNLSSAWSVELLPRFQTFQLLDSPLLLTLNSGSSTPHTTRQDI